MLLLLVMQRTQIVGIPQLKAGVQSAAFVLVRSTVEYLPHPLHLLSATLKTCLTGVIFDL